MNKIYFYKGNDEEIFIDENLLFFLDREELEQQGYYLEYKEIHDIKPFLLLLGSQEGIEFPGIPLVLDQIDNNSTSKEYWEYIFPLINSLSYEVFNKDFNEVIKEVKCNSSIATIDENKFIGNIYNISIEDPYCYYIFNVGSWGGFDIIEQTIDGKLKHIMSTFEENF